MPCLRHTSTTVDPASASRSTRRISSSVCPRLPIPTSSSSLQDNHGGRELSTSKRLSFWVLGQRHRRLVAPAKTIIAFGFELSVRKQAAYKPMLMVLQLRSQRVDASVN